MGCCPTQIVVNGRTARHSRVEEDNAIVLGVARVLPGERSIAQESLDDRTLNISDSRLAWCNTYSIGTRFEPHRVEIKVSLASTAQLLLHLALERAAGANRREPLGVGSTIHTCKLEPKAGASVVMVQDIDLLLDLRQPVGSR
jgi:hypothetical protein